jgi:Transglycosylase SLT domain
MRTCLGAALVAIAASSAAAARAGSLACEREMTRAAALHGVPLNVLYSVGLTETGSRGELSPYDMNVDGQAVHSTSLAEAMARFAQARGRGAKFIDIGCMQINHRFHSAEFRSLSDMFDPVRNVEYAANFLKALRAQEGSWTLAVARYNAGPGNPTAERTYVCSVIRNMIASLISFREASDFVFKAEERVSLRFPACSFAKRRARPRAGLWNHWGAKFMISRDRLFSMVCPPFRFAVFLSPFPCQEPSRGRWSLRLLVWGKIGHWISALTRSGHRSRHLLKRQINLCLF